ncbi:MAG: hypothetical protein WAW41_09995, partial [Methylobacter sp.]
LPADNPLIGTWVQIDKKEITYLHFGNGGHAGKMVEVELHENGMLKTESFTVSVTTVGENNYLSVQATLLPPTYFLLKYRLTEKNILTLWPANYPFMANAVQKGMIAGTSESKSLIPRVLLSTDSENLQRFVGEHDSQMFSEKVGEFRRVS